MQDFNITETLTNGWWNSLINLALNPKDNPKASLILLAIAVIVVLIVGLTILVVVATARARRPKDSKELQELQELLTVLDAAEGGGSETPEEAPEPVVVPPKPNLWPLTITFAVVGLMVVWVGIGITTSATSVCKACHATTGHELAAKMGQKDPHANTECVTCHESNSAVGRATFGVPARLAHFVNGARKTATESGYGLVVSGTCERCHADVNERVTTDEVRGVRMAHKQTTEAGAECLSCHTARSGIVGMKTVGMTPCLRCHDNETQSSDCKLCHTKDVALATRPDISPAKLSGRELVKTPDCGACHDQAKSCDPCHAGQRMPHTQDFLTGGHARLAAIDVWYNGGKKCGRCHTAERRPCTSCHTMMPGHAVPTFAADHKSSDIGACITCHDAKPHQEGRDFCLLCHGKPYVTQ